MLNTDYSLLIYYVIFIYTVMGTILTISLSQRYLNKSKVITIVRGVPGIGKDTYVEYVEHNKNDMEIYSICNDDMFFIHTNKSFSIKDMADARKYTLQLFIEYIRQGVNRIYVTNINNSIKDYEHFIRLGRLHNYKINIVQIDCYNDEYLEYFNSRSKHNISDAHLYSMYNNWDTDMRESIIEPYIGNLPGDVLPIKKNLNIDLEEYYLNGGNDTDKKIDSDADSEYSPDSDSDSESDSDSDSESDSDSASDLDIQYNIEINNNEYNKIVTRSHSRSLTKSFVDTTTSEGYEIIYHISNKDIINNNKRFFYVKILDNVLTSYLGCIKLY